MINEGKPAFHVWLISRVALPLILLRKTLAKNRFACDFNPIFAADMRHLVSYGLSHSDFKGGGTRHALATTLLHALAGSRTFLSHLLGIGNQGPVYLHPVTVLQGLGQFFQLAENTRL